MELGGGWGWGGVGVGYGGGGDDIVSLTSLCQRI